MLAISLVKRPPRYMDEKPTHASHGTRFNFDSFRKLKPKLETWRFINKANYAFNQSARVVDFWGGYVPFLTVCGFRVGRHN